jgi:nucleotide-binding universal stress UspA family protein
LADNAVQEKGSLMFRTILVPLDGSPFAEQALPYALSLARRADARLELVRAHLCYADQAPSNAFLPYDPELEANCFQEERLCRRPQRPRAGTGRRVKAPSAPSRRWACAAAAWWS